MRMDFAVQLIVYIDMYINTQLYSDRVYRINHVVPKMYYTGKSDLRTEGHNSFILYELWFIIHTLVYVAFEFRTFN
jgi:hypothetical protein